MRMTLLMRLRTKTTMTLTTTKNFKIIIKLNVLELLYAHLERLRMVWSCMVTYSSAKSCVN